MAEEKVATEVSFAEYIENSVACFCGDRYKHLGTFCKVSPHESHVQVSSQLPNAPSKRAIKLSWGNVNEDGIRFTLASVSIAQSEQGVAMDSVRRLLSEIMSERTLFLQENARLSLALSSAQSSLAKALDTHQRWVAYKEEQEEQVYLKVLSS